MSLTTPRAPTELGFDAADPFNYAVSYDNMADRDDTNGAETPHSAAQYIASLTQELARLAKRNGLDTLGYILEMARIEAEQNIDD